MPERLTAGNEFLSSQLRTPKASDGVGGALGERLALQRGNSVGIRDQIMDLVAEQGLKVTRSIDYLLPTPTVSDGKGAARSEVAEQNPHNRLKVEVELLPTPKARDSQAEGYEAGLRRATPQVGTIVKGLVEGDERVLLPTPRVSSANGSTAKERAAGNPKHRLETEVEMKDDFRWGRFAPAIYEWEQILGRPAPAPTKPDGKDGSHRLSSKFTEWMMGLPDGWITGVGLRRNEELKACGNGVVPQQAELALRILLEME